MPGVSMPARMCHNSQRTNPSISYTDEPIFYVKSKAVLIGRDGILDDRSAGRETYSRSSTAPARPQLVADPGVEEVRAVEVVQRRRPLDEREHLRRLEHRQ